MANREGAAVERLHRLQLENSLEMAKAGLIEGSCTACQAGPGVGNANACECQSNIYWPTVGICIGKMFRVSRTLAQIKVAIRETAD